MQRITIAKYFITFILMWAYILEACSGSLPGASKSDIIEDELKRYGYEYKELQSFIEEIGYPEFLIGAPYDVSRNSSGTALRFYSSSRKQIIVVGCDASIEEVKIPGRSAWLNDENEIVAWFDSGRVHYNNGMVEEGVFVRNGGADPSGRYFVKKVRSKLVEIFAISDPQHALADAELIKPKIFVYDNEVFLFGNADMNTIKVHVFNISSQKLVKKEELIVRRPKSSSAPFTLKDYNVQSGEMLIVDVWDWPAKSKWYTFSIGDRKLQKAGYANSVGFYMQCDPLDSVREKRSLRENGSSRETVQVKYK